MTIFSWMILIHKGGWFLTETSMKNGSLEWCDDFRGSSILYPVGSTGVFNSHGSQHLRGLKGLRNISRSNASKISSPILYIFIQQYWAFQQGRHPHVDDHWSLVQLGRLSGWSSCWRNWCNSLGRTCLEMLTRAWHMIITVCNVNIYVHLRVHVQRKNPHHNI